MYKRYNSSEISQNAANIWQLECQQRQPNTNKLTANTNFRHQNENNVVVYQPLNEYWVSWIACIILRCSDIYLYRVNRNKRYNWAQYFIQSFNKYLNFYNIESKLKCNPVISVLSEHITIYRTLLVDNCNSNVNNYKQTKRKQQQK